ncbi:ferrochelatase [Formicincola oecophyllae]|uniref:Ferrochelatase n=2 Tax=Formicincola oecophyllae TaxID=2558361 RepID=A0A4Y6UB08_9PROT|nr:ferrochelatase [Formicincola oecophyllae]
MGDRTGVLLMALGTPEGTDYRSVRSFLSEFLSDQRVVELTPWLWKPLLEGVVLLSRPFRSGALYKRIWDEGENDSPLRVITRRQAAALGKRLARDDVPVAWAMRYGRPSIAEAVERLVAQGCGRIIALPLFPQYSATTNATANDALFRVLMKERRQPAVMTLPSFPTNPAYIQALAGRVRESLATLAWQPQLLVASFHGLPLSYVEKGDPYPLECAATVKALAAALGWPENKVPLTYQSRFGFNAWLQPSTVDVVTALPGRGIKRIAVTTPGFMADCIETLDEIGRDLKQRFLAAGGEDFVAVPCLNESPGGIATLESVVRQALQGYPALQP